MEIRPENPRDIEAIRELTTAAFAAAEHRSGTEAAIVDALRGAGALTLSLVAVSQGELAGHIAFSPVLVEGKDCGWYGLAPLSVKPDRQHRGIGQELVRDGLRRLLALGAAGCVVLGAPAYYQRFGYACDARLRFGGAPAEYFLRLAFAGTIPVGEVTYHTAFGTA